MLTASPQIHTPADEPVDQSVLDNEAQSVGHLFRDRVAASPDRPAYLYAKVSDSGDEWVTVTWSQLDEVVREIGAGLIALGADGGFGLFDRVGGLEAVEQRLDQIEAPSPPPGSRRGPR